MSEWLRRQPLCLYAKDKSILRTRLLIGKGEKRKTKADKGKQLLEVRSLYKTKFLAVEICISYRIFEHSKYYFERFVLFFSSSLSINFAMLAFDHFDEKLRIQSRSKI